MCPALAVSKRLQTLPLSCGTSRMKINAKCSFTCPQGLHQLNNKVLFISSAGLMVSGPTRLRRFHALVSFETLGLFINLLLQYNNQRLIFADIDECSLPNNGGCSHRCVNTMRSYKCQCPDPELSLSPDNKTCHGKMKILNRCSWLVVKQKVFQHNFYDSNTIA